MQEQNTLKKLDLTTSARMGVPELRPYIPGKPTLEVKEELGLDEIIKLASNECPLTLPQTLGADILAELPNLTRYPDGNCRILGRKLAPKLGVETSNLLFGNGAEECIRLVAQAFLNHGDEAIIPKPIFDAYETATILCGAQPVMVPLKGYEIDLQGILQKISPQTKMIWLCSPANPTGPVMKKQDLDEFLKALPENILVVLDEAYREFVTEPDCAKTEDYLGKDDRVIGLRTFSKAFGLAGLRVGYIIANPCVVDLIAKVKLPFNVNVLAQACALSLLNDEAFAEKHIDMVITERKKLSQKLMEMGLEVAPSQTNFLFVKLPVSGDEVFKKLLLKGFIIRPGSVFGKPDYIRLSLGDPSQNQRFLESLKTILAES